MDRLCSFNGPHTILRLPHMKLAEIMELLRKKYYELLRRGWKQGFHQKTVPVWGHGSKWDILCGIDRLGDSQLLPYIYLLIFLFIQTLTLSPSSASMDDGDIQPSFHWGNKLFHCVHTSNLWFFYFFIFFGPDKALDKRTVQTTWDKRGQQNRMNGMSR